jgi:hypothetical protein
MMQQLHSTPRSAVVMATYSCFAVLAMCYEEANLLQEWVKISSRIVFAGRHACCSPLVVDASRSLIPIG